MNAMDEDWELLASLLPTGWVQQRIRSEPTLREGGFASTSALLRTLLLHVGKGYSLRETVMRAKAGGLADVSGVALMKRLQKAEGWLGGLCGALRREAGWEVPAEGQGYQVRALDG